MVWARGAGLPGRGHGDGSGAPYAGPAQCWTPPANFHPSSGLFLVTLTQTAEDWGGLWLLAKIPASMLGDVMSGRSGVSWKDLEVLPWHPWQRSGGHGPSGISLEENPPLPALAASAGEVRWAVSAASLRGQLGVAAPR